MPRRRIDVHVDARPEPDESVTLAARKSVARLYVTQDPPRNESRHLHAGDVLPAEGRDVKRVALIAERRLVERCVDERSGLVPDLHNDAVDGAAIRMHVEHVHEHADLERIAIEVRVTRALDFQHAPVCRTEHRARPVGRVTRWITKELDDEGDGDPRQDRDRPQRRERQRKRDHDGERDIRPALAGDQRMRIGNFHGMRCARSSACRLIVSSSPRARSIGVTGAAGALDRSAGASPRPGLRSRSAGALDLRSVLSPESSPYCFSASFARKPTIASASSSTMSPTQPRWRCLSAHVNGMMNSIAATTCHSERSEESASSRRHTKTDPSLASSLGMTHWPHAANVSIAALVHELVLLDPWHHRAQLLADLL